MTALVLLAAVPVLIWLVQSIGLRRAGLPLRWRLDARGAPGHLRLATRIATQIGLLGVIVAYPLARGLSPVVYYAALLPRDRAAAHFAWGFCAAAAFLAVLFVVWLSTERLIVEVHHARRKWIRRLALLVPTALLGAFVEELLFRGVVMADLLYGGGSRGAAVMIGALVFAVAHYVRAVKRHWTFPGHVMLGVLLCVAFLGTRTLWLPAGLHAGGILLIMGVRPFVRYAGPAWLTGASIFPFAGVVGVLALGVLTWAVMQAFGGFPL
jgi:membrane protease YdiL (CAAX protease family)